MVQDEFEEEFSEISETPEILVSFLSFPQFVGRCWKLWKLRREVRHLQNWSGSPLPLALTEGEVQGVEEAEVIARWCFSPLPRFAEELKELAKQLP